MDPNTALARIREAIEAYDNEEAEAPEALDEIRFTFAGLDDWLSRDGFLPDDWKAEEDKA